LEAETEFELMDKDSVMIVYDRALSKINNTLNDQLWLLCWKKIKTKVIIKIVPVTEAFELAFWMTWQYFHSLPLQRYRSFY